MLNALPCSYWDGNMERDYPQKEGAEELNICDQPTEGPGAYGTIIFNR